MGGSCYGGRAARYASENPAEWQPAGAVDAPTSIRQPSTTTGKKIEGPPTPAATAAARVKWVLYGVRVDGTLARLCGLVEAAANSPPQHPPSWTTLRPDGARSDPLVVRWLQTWYESMITRPRAGFFGAEELPRMKGLPPSRWFLLPTPTTTTTTKAAVALAWVTFPRRGQFRRRDREQPEQPLLYVVPPSTGSPPPPRLGLVVAVGARLALFLWDAPEGAAPLPGPAVRTALEQIRGRQRRHTATTIGFHDDFWLP